MSKASDIASGPTAAENGKLRVASVVATDGREEASVFALVASVAGGLETRIGAAILENAEQRDIHIPAVERFDEQTRAGVVASVDGHTVVLGNQAFFAAFALPVESLGDWPERLRQRGEYVLFVAIDGRTVGFVALVETGDETTHTNCLMEDNMRASQSPADHFPTDTADVPRARATELIELADGDRFELRIAPVTRRLGNAVVRLLAYNGSVPGPVLRVRQGSELLVTVVNDGDLEATVHWHGLRLDNRSDGTTETQRPIPIGGTFTYRLTFPDPGIYWYHPHIREDYGQEMGLYGTIVVAPADAEYWPAAHRELTLTLDDILLEDGKIAPFSRTHPTYTAMGRFGNMLLVNGEPELSLRAQQGEIVRFYLTNTANTRVFNVAIPGARMKLVGGDSGRYERETFVDDVVIAPSERVVVDAMFDRPGQLTLVHRTPHRTYPLGIVDVGADRAEPSLAAEFHTLRINADMAAARGVVAAYLEAEPDKTLALVADMNMGEPQVATGATLGYVCPMHPEVTSAQAQRCPKCGMKLLPAELVATAARDTHDSAGHDRHGHDHQHSDDKAEHHDVPAGIEWEDDMVDVNRMTNPTNMRWKLVDRETGAEGAAIDWRFRVGDRVKIRLVNEVDSDHPMQHPFHLHGAGRFLILSRDGVTDPNLVWKDTVLVPTGQTVDILLDVTHPGVWMAHCHIAEHHESGMMLRFRVDADGRES